MKKLDEILQELGISKVKLSKYLGVSRQMVYNYLELENLNKWPKEKKLLLFKLLDIEDGSEETLNNIKINTDYILEVEARLNQNSDDSNKFDNIYDLKKLKKDEQELFSKITFIIKDKFTDSYKHNENMAILKYLYHTLQSIDNINEIKYFFAYISKMNGYTDPNEFKFNENNQFLFEGLFYYTLKLYSSGRTSKSKVTEIHKKFVDAVNQSKEEKLSRTQKLNGYFRQALQELGYDDLTNENYGEVLERITEIESRSSS